MRFFKALIALVLLLALIGNSAAGNVSENSRQGFGRIFATSHLKSPSPNQELCPVSRVCFQYHASDAVFFDSDGNQVAAVENGDETRFMWSADNRLTNVEKDLPCAKHGKNKCGQCPPVITAEEYSYLPQDWRRVTRSVFTHDGQRCKHGYGYGHGRGHVCDEIPGHGKGHNRDGQNDESVYVSVYDNQDESHEYLLKAGDRDVHNQRHEQHKCTADQQKPSLELVRSFIGGPSADDLEYTRQDHRSLTMLKDALGSTIALTVSDGRPLARIGYDVWGNLRWPDKPGHSLKPCDDKDVPDWLERFENGRSFGQGIDPWHFGRHNHKTLTPYLYTGRRFDPFAGQYFNRNRYYHPRYGRFLSPDPISFEGGSNLWFYANNSPARFTDSWGLTVEELVDRLKPTFMSMHACIIESAYDDYVQKRTTDNWNKLRDSISAISGLTSDDVIQLAFDDKEYLPKPYSSLRDLSITGFESHHILPKYLGRMLGYSESVMLAHPAIYLTHSLHQGGGNSESAHALIRDELPPVPGVVYSVLEIRNGLIRAYAQFGKPSWRLFAKIAHLIKKVP